MTILDIGPIAPAIGAAKLREPVTISGDFTIWLDYSQDLTQGEWLYALGSAAQNGDVFSVNAGEIWLSGGGATIDQPHSDPGSVIHSLRVEAN